MKNRLIESFSDKYFRERCYALTMKSYSIQNEISKLKLRLSAIFKKEEEIRFKTAKEFIDDNYESVLDFARKNDINSRTAQRWVCSRSNVFVGGDGYIYKRVGEINVQNNR